MIIRTSKEEINKYYENSAMNQSLLKKLIQGPAAYVAAQQEPEQKLYYQEKGHFIIGKAVDCYITEGVDEFNSLYYISDKNKKPKSEKIMSILKMAFNILLIVKAIKLINEINIENDNRKTNQQIKVPTIEELVSDIILEENAFTTEDWSIILYESCNLNEYYMNRAKPSWREDTRSETLKKDNYLPYLNSLKEAQGKQILSEDESNIINGIIMSLTTHPYIKDYFSPINNNVDIIMQLPIYFTFSWQEETIDEEGIDLTDELPEHEEDCKALLDIVIIDHVAKTIQPIDLKTSEGEPYWFLGKLKQFEYQIQAAYYTSALMEWIKNEKRPSLFDYTILPFKFIVESTTPALQGNPLVFICTNELLNLGLNGRPEMILQLDNIDNTFKDYIVYHKIKGIKDLFSDLIWYKEHEFNKRREIKEGNHFILDYHKIEAIEFVPTNNINE